MKQEKKRIDECIFKVNIGQAFDMVVKQLATGEYGIAPSRLSPEAFDDWEKSVRLALEEEVKRHYEVIPQETQLEIL